jgi:SAM-dependent methyltransferase
LAKQLRTQDENYTARLIAKESAWWKRLLDAQAPYRWNLRRLNMGFTLDIGCGIGRNLINLDGNGIGIDHNPKSIEIAKSRGLQAFTADEFNASSFNAPGSFDSCRGTHDGAGSNRAIKILSSSCEAGRAGNHHNASGDGVSLRPHACSIHGF